MLKELSIFQLIPNNFYINESKLNKIREVYKNKKEGDLPPVTVAIINNEYALIDGHSRTMAAIENNKQTVLAKVFEIEAIEGPTKLYLKIHEEAKAKGLTSIIKLKDNIITDNEHESLWVNYCSKLMKEIELGTKSIEEKMYKIATEFIPKRYPKGWGGVAVVRCEDDTYFTSVSIETANSSVDLCIEVGAMCEAHKYKVRVTHCLCVVRDDENSPFKVLSPCGVCQERLRYWGEDVRVGVTTKDNSLKFITLKELQPYHWTNAYKPEELESFYNDNL